MCVCNSNLTWFSPSFPLVGQSDLSWGWFFEGSSPKMLPTGIYALNSQKWQMAHVHWGLAVSWAPKGTWVGTHSFCFWKASTFGGKPNASCLICSMKLESQHVLHDVCHIPWLVCDISLTDWSWWTSPKRLSNFVAQGSHKARFKKNAKGSSCTIA